MTEDERWELLVRLDDEHLRGGVQLSEWCSLIVREADVAFVRDAQLASILTAVAGMETYLRAEMQRDGVGKNLAQLIDTADIEEDLRDDLHRLRRYRNRWVHVEAAWDDNEVLAHPERFEGALEDMAFFAARVLRRTIYSDQLL